ncbi:endolytic transglycosylase MltG [Oscillospiraceae bacterium LTW-04]|nr:endolytic transglycosylase MltG [Oscillospiraceae bacterium MB24-C1]
MRKNLSEERPQPEGRRRRRRSNGMALLVSVLLVLGAAGFLAFFAISSATDLLAFGKEDRQIEVTIENGMSVNQIAQLLGEKGVVEQPLTFRLYAALRKKDNDFQAGSYVFNSNMSYDRIITALRSGDIIKEEVTITFYEGMTLREIAASLEENKVCSAEDFISYTQTSELPYEFVDMMPENDLRFYRLEGYLFPDTYDFYVGENVQSVAKKFLKNFQNRIMPELYSKIQDAGMTLDEVITLASVIQKEAGNPDEMSMVSSVFHNRIDDVGAGLPMLQSDVTIFYVENDIKPYQSRATQEVYDAYNTYVCKGLPVGPICSPGLDAIKAAINPEESQNYFFVTDINGKYYYSKTLDEHYANVRRAAAAGGAEHGTDVQ